MKGPTYDLECHPSERAMGDLESASDCLEHMNKAGFEGTVGFNLDGSLVEWQNVSVIQFIREFAPYIHCAHVKGVQVECEHCRGGRLGGHRPMGHWTNGWKFVTAGTMRDAIGCESGDKKPEGCSSSLRAVVCSALSLRTFERSGTAGNLLIRASERPVVLTHLRENRRRFGQIVLVSLSGSVSRLAVGCLHRGLAVRPGFREVPIT